MLRFTKSTLVVFLGFVFIFSAIAKMVPLEFFEFQIAEIIEIPWRTVQLIARIIIAFEFALGIVLIAHVELRKVTLPTVIGLLTVFTLLLVFQYIKHGNQENCGCFGDQVRMSTTAGILKNVVLIITAIIVYKIAPTWEWRLGRFKKFIPLLFLGLMMIPWFMMKPIEWRSVTERKKLKQEVHYDQLYDPQYTDSTPSFDYHEGKHIIMFVDLKCGHCKLAVAKASIMKEKQESLPFLIVMNGPPEQTEKFLETTHAYNLERIYFSNTPIFIRLAGGGGFPSINWVNDGMLDYKTLHFDLLQEDINKWLNE